MSRVEDDRRQGPPRRLPRSTGIAVVAGILVVLLLVIVIGVKALFGGGSGDDFSGSGKGEVLVKIASRATATDIGKTLEDLGVVKTSQAFVTAANKDTRSRSIQPGSYTLRSDMSGQAALTLLLDPKSRAFVPLLIPEGLSQNEVLQRVSDTAKIPLADVQAAAADPASLGVPTWAAGHLEGLLFPATYQIQPEATAKDILSMMVARFNQEAASLNLVARAAEQNVTPYQVVIVASLAEREARKDDEYAKVSRVIYNRLAKKQRLEIDATVLYGLGRTKGALSAADLAKPTPYNTRLNVPGLPPTPIASPGSKALEAALEPADGDWLYYVIADKDGTQFYTSDYNAFLRQKNASQQQGLI